jgi:Uma2 family endonuclease
MTATLLSADAYLATGDSRPRWTELIHGEVRIMNSPTLRHARVVAALQFALRSWTKGGSARGEAPGTLDIRIDDSTVVAPDVLWFAAGRLADDDAVFVSFVADLVVEVRSPSTWRYDITTKFAIYEQAGVPELWMVDTAANTVLVYRRSAPHVPAFDIALELAAGEELTSPMLPGFSLAIAALFER